MQKPRPNNFSPELRKLKQNKLSACIKHHKLHSSACGWETAGVKRDALHGYHDATIALQQLDDADLNVIGAEAVVGIAGDEQVLPCSTRLWVR
jgi:hypothetical protein